eukprot:CAMPEP_0172890932 /NCGR_PEP_ID=MMETSP1075-20121228/142485_1 /TAXON_ID=2916 /ORGANISM="Ceratium fusus, Strain PA161109" /LENGTH=43 /DNA_ID= /DNA_START= /DNA_END= /DNA_ORIENTATION=
MGSHASTRTRIHSSVSVSPEHHDRGGSGVSGEDSSSSSSGGSG